MKMNCSMSHEYRAYLTEERNKGDALIRLMFTFCGDESTTLVLTPKIEFSKKFPEFQKYERNSEEYKTFLVKTLLPVILDSLYVDFNRRTKTLETTVMLNRIFDECVIFDVIDKTRLNMIAETIDEYEENLGEELDEVVLFKLVRAACVPSNN